MGHLSAIDKIKLVMLFAMTTGHIAWAFVPTDTWLSDGLHFVARITIPLACFLVVIGYQKTKDIYGYMTRLLGFALLAQIPFVMAQTGIAGIVDTPSILLVYGNVLFSLLFGLLAVTLADGRHFVRYLSVEPRVFGVLLLLWLSSWSDWSFATVLWVLAIYYRGALGFFVITAGLLVSSLMLPKDSPFVIAHADKVMDYGLFLAVPIMFWYNKNAHIQTSYRLPRLLFYWYYVVHLLVIGLVVSF